MNCYAESRDGIHWTKPVLGLFEFGGSKQNNIVWDGIGTHNFTPFKDANPSASAQAKYKALGYGEAKAGKGLFAFQSEDAIHWTLISETPVITKGAFDSQNLAFWDVVRGEYREYHRDFREGRDIRTGTSKDFLHWTEPEFLDYTPGRISELYTNQVIPYFRAPHLFLGFPTRYVDRGWTRSAEQLPRPEYRRLRGAKSRREGTAVTDTMFMTSRDGKASTSGRSPSSAPACAPPIPGSMATFTRTGDCSRPGRPSPTRLMSSRCMSPRIRCRSARLTCGGTACDWMDSSRPTPRSPAARS